MAVVSAIKGFFKSRFNLYLFILLIIIGSALILSQPIEPEEEIGFTVHYFYLPSCSRCHEQDPIIRELQEEMDEIEFAFHDASTAEGARLFYKLALEQGMDTTRLRTPTIILEHGYLIDVHSKEEIIDAIEECKEICAVGIEVDSGAQEISTGFSEFELPFFGRVDLMSFSLPALAIVLGLVDGFNPCAMWVLVYLIALLIEVDDKKKMWTIVGSFVLASGILYFLFMTAWLNVFLLLGYVRILTIIIGLVALGGGILGLKDYLTAKDELECKVGDESSHKKTMDKVKKIVAQPISIPIIAAIIGLAFVVNSVEFVCSSAIPAVFTQILALSNISTLAQYGYILLYVFFFMLDDLVIFSLAVFAVSSDFGKKYAKYCKLVGGIVLVILGLMLLFAPQLLG